MKCFHEETGAASGITFIMATEVLVVKGILFRIWGKIAQWINNILFPNKLKIYDSTIND